MSHFAYYRLTAISIGICLLNAISIDPAAAKNLVTIVDRQTPVSKLGLDIGLQPIVPYKVSQQSNGQSTANGRNSAGIGVTARVGTLGAGVEVAKSLTPQFNGRLGLNFGNVGFNRNDSGINYDSQLNFSSVQLFGDYYPFASSSFRVTGGLVAQNNRFSVTGKPGGNGTYTIDGIQYPASAVGTLSGEYKYGNSIAPYLGIGIGKSTNEGFGFNADLGVMFTGAPKVSLNASNPAFNNNPITRGQLDNQVRQTENDLRGFNVYPVLSVGLSYGF
ncbi:hypothetical protein [Chamaesiphon minutus]|uniref:Uncharacterized protein n=1 Tax=Chamaesiphon minutus (strain ATCC 27169 / PCC 6605) TaxID=1173020 RepID=K9U8V3_CHAP6|nr:hypothetical protein [Chamaesiphon minutus]AFY91517.1 hypothetical protein Cha6605_0215 [Chamaesiphon minutus PCC 6605]